MKKIILIIFVLLVMIFGYGFFVLAKPMELSKPGVEVLSVEGEVEINHNNSWEDLKVGGDILSGDTIKTGENGEVSINFYNGANSRIAPNSEVVFDELFIDDNNYSKTGVSLKVSLGRVWSRIIQMSDKESTFEVGSDQTVATVRGTVFDFYINKEGVVEISSLEDLVEVSNYEKRDNQKNGERELKEKFSLVQGKKTQVDQTRDEYSMKIMVITEKDKQDDWFKDNMEEDKKFDEFIKDKKEEQVKDMAGPLPGSAIYKLKTVSEKLKIATTFDENKKEELKINFNIKRIVESQELLRQGKKEFAGDTLKRSKEEIMESLAELDKINPETKTGLKEDLRNVLDFQKKLMDEFGPGMQEFEIKKELEDLKFKISDKEDLNFLYYKQLEERIDELSRLKENDFDEFVKYWRESEIELQKLSEKLNVPELIERIEIKKGILFDIKKEEENDEKESGEEQVEKNIEEDVFEPIIKEDARLLEETKEPIVEDFKTEPQADDDSINLLDQRTEENIIEPEPLVEPEQKKVEAIELKIVSSRLNMQANAELKFSAIMVFNDGHELDVSSDVNWSLSGDIGSVNQNGLLKSDLDGGKGFVKADYVIDGKNFSSTSKEITALTIQPF